MYEMFGDQCRDMLMLGLKVKVSSAQGTTKTNRNPTSKSM